MDTGKVDLPFTGIASFCKAPVCTDWHGLDADVAILGVPFDMSTQARSGTRYGPRAIREASTMYSLGPDGYYDHEIDEYRMRGVRMADCGDVDMCHMDALRCLQNTYEYAAALAGESVLPVFLGGDHAVTVPLVQALSDVMPLHVVSFDAHLDFVDEKHGIRAAQNNPMRRISEMQRVLGITVIGVTGLGSSKREDFSAARAYGAEIVGGAELRRIGPEETAARIPDDVPLYVTIDIDCMSAAFAPGTGVPSPSGMDYHHLIAMLRSIARRSEVVGFDLCEVAPMYDPTGLTSQVAADVIVDFLGSIFLRRFKRSGDEDGPADRALDQDD